MKRLLLCVSVLSIAVVVGGCPIYSASPDCGSDGCYGPSSGFAVYPDATDCSNGCPSGYVCKLAGGQTQCVPSARPPSDSGSPTDTSVPESGSRVDGADAPSVPPDAAAPDSLPPEAGETPDVAESGDGSPAMPAVDASGGADAPAPVTCNAAADCAAGDTCVNGRCTPQSQLCSDTTQCTTPSEACVNGICEPHCSSSSPCPAGYECDFTRGVCSLNPSPCTGSGPTHCQGGSTCVEGRCVAPCASSDSGAACPAGQICVNGGCIPDEAARFTCKNDGQSGTLATACASTEICLHHDCYAACDPDAANPCTDPSTGCKQVTVTAGTYIVCASTSSLGSDCDLAAGKPCSNGVCIDGYCR
jgi:hypothetical protein